MPRSTSCSRAPRRSSGWSSPACSRANTPSVLASRAEVAATSMATGGLTAEGEPVAASGARGAMLRSPPEACTTGTHRLYHALDARREDSRRRMWIALAINVGDAGRRGGRRRSHRVAGRPRRRRPRPLRRRLDRPRPDRRTAGPDARPAGRRTFGYQRSEVLAALVNGLLLVLVGDRDRGRGIGRLGRPAGDRRGGGARPSAYSAWPATSPRPWSWPAASARTSTLRGCCGTAPPTHSARSGWSSPAPSSSPAAPTSSTRSSAC